MKEKGNMGKFNEGKGKCGKFDEGKWEIWGSLLKEKGNLGKFEEKGNSGEV